MEYKVYKLTCCANTITLVLKRLKKHKKSLFDFENQIFRKSTALFF